MLDYGLNLTAINGELGRMIELGNKLYFRKKRYVYSVLFYLYCIGTHF